MNSKLLLEEGNQIIIDENFWINKMMLYIDIIMYLKYNFDGIIKY